MSPTITGGGQQGRAGRKSDDPGGRAWFQVYRDSRSDSEGNGWGERRIGSGHASATTQKALALDSLPAELLECVPGGFLYRFRILQIADV